MTQIPHSRGYAFLSIFIGLLLLGSACGTSHKRGFYRPYAGKGEHAYKAVGIASWYGGKFHGRLTASGERYDMNQLTAAHRSLPFGAMLKITNLANGREVVVKVNDRGPFIRGRVIDLSKEAAERLAFLHAGTAKVRIEWIQDQPDHPNLSPQAKERLAKRSAAPAPDPVAELITRPSPESSLSQE